MNRRAVIVEDEVLVALYFEDILTDLGWEVCGTATSADAAVAIVLAQHPALVLMDVRLKGVSDGVDAAHRIRGETACPIIFITGSSEPKTLARVQQVSAATVLIKPILADQLKRAIEDVTGTEAGGWKATDGIQG